MHIVFVTISYGYLSVGKDYHMSEHNQKHLTLSNTPYIKQKKKKKKKKNTIDEVLHKDPSTISKEVKRYSKTVPAKYSYKCNLCNSNIILFVSMITFTSTTIIYSTYRTAKQLAVAILKFIAPYY